MSERGAALRAVMRSPHPRQDAAVVKPTPPADSWWADPAAQADRAVFRTLHAKAQDRMSVSSSSSTATYAPLDFGAWTGAVQPKDIIPKPPQPGLLRLP